MATSSTKPADSHPGFHKFLTRFHKKSTHIDLLRTLMYKTQKKSRSPELTRASTRGYKLRKSRPHPSDLCKYVLNFRKRTIPGDPPCSDLQNPKILATRRTATRLHAPPESSAIISVFSHAVTRRRRKLTRLHALDAPSADTCPLRMTSWMTSSSTTRFD